MSLVGFKAKNHGQQVRKRGADDGVDERITPDSIYNRLHAIHGFTLDAAASESNAKCPKFFTLKSCGLSQSWAGETVWCNPPYSNCKEWVQKAFAEVYGLGCIEPRCPKVVMLLPANRTEQNWWQEFIEPARSRGLGVSVSFLRGRQRFGWPSGRVVPAKGDRPPFGLCVVVFEHVDTDCGVCRGVGHGAPQFGEYAPCSACGGSGERRRVQP